LILPSLYTPSPSPPSLLTGPSSDRITPTTANRAKSQPWTPKTGALRVTVPHQHLQAISGLLANRAIALFPQDPIPRNGTQRCVPKPQEDHRVRAHTRQRLNRAKNQPRRPGWGTPVAPAGQPHRLRRYCTAPMREVFGNGVLVPTDSPSGWGLTMTGFTHPVPLLNATNGAPLPDISGFKDRCLRVNGLLPHESGTLSSPAFHPLELQEEPSGGGPTPLTVLVSGNLGDAPSAEIERGDEVIATDRVRATLCFHSPPGKAKGSWIRITGRKPSSFFELLSSFEKGTAIIVGGTFEEYEWQERLLYRLDCRALSRLRTPSATPQATAVLNLERPAEDLEEGF
jgi:hypothetical protein